MRYVVSRYKEKQRETSYRIYVTDSMQLIPQNKYLTRRYAESLTNRPVDNRSGDEVAEDVIKKIGLKFKGGD